MNKIEVDEGQFLATRKTVELLNKMLAHPEARRKVLEAHKTIDPNVVIPEIDARKPVDDAVKSLESKFEKFMSDFQSNEAKKQQEAERNAFVSRFEQGRSRLREQYGVTDDGLKKIEELMQQHNIVDHDIAHAAFTRMYPEPEPAPPTPNFGFNGLFGDVSKNPDEFIKSMHASKGNDEAALDRRIHEILTDVRQQNRPQGRR